MKASPKKLLPLIVFAIAVTSLFSVQPAQAYTVTLEQMGANVVANGSGPINLTGLTFTGPGRASPGINPNSAAIRTGAPATVDFYLADLAGPTSFGSGSGFGPSSASGDMVGILADIGLGVGNGELLVPQGYVSGNALTDSTTFNNQTFASLGLTPGTYVWSWGDGANQRFTLQIGGVGVPDGGSTVSLLGFALFGLAALRRKLPLLRGES